jgi:hypothetical protein
VSAPSINGPAHTRRFTAKIGDSLVDFVECHGESGLGRFIERRSEAGIIKRMDPVRRPRRMRAKELGYVREPVHRLIGLFVADEIIKKNEAKTRCLHCLQLAGVG